MTREQSPSTRFTGSGLQCERDGYHSRRFTCTPSGGTDIQQPAQPSELVDAVVELKQPGDQDRRRGFNTNNNNNNNNNIAEMTVQ